MENVMLLAALRKKHNMTQKELAKILDVTPGTVGMWESGKRNPSLSRAIQVAKIFGIQVENICFSNNKEKNIE